jgi:hypothetical protein
MNIKAVKGITNHGKRSSIAAPKIDIITIIIVLFLNVCI